MSDKRQNWRKAVAITHKAPYPFAEQLRKERRAAKAAAESFVRACRTGDVAALYAAVNLINETTVGGWTVAMRAVARQVQTVSPEIQQAFLAVWIESKVLRLYVSDDLALCAAARVLLPSYQGPGVRMFRGASAGERRQRIYGLSWTANVAVAEKFARERQVWRGGSVLLETLAPPEAIICAVDYPEPFTQDEIERLRSEYPNIQITDFYEEREYVVDRRHLNDITVVRRYAQVGRSGAPHAR